MANLNYLSKLPVDLFLQQITYLPFSKVVTLCSSNTKFHNYCTNPAYSNQWKSLIESTFSGVYNYSELLAQIQNELNLEGKYNYLIYVKLVQLLDPISQLMIYYRQGDIESWNDRKFSKPDRFLALFLLNKKNEMLKYLPNSSFLRFVDVMDGKTVSHDGLNWMALEMAKHGNMKGLLLLKEKGANIHAWDEAALIGASYHGRLPIVKYLVEQGADIHAENGAAIRFARKNNHLAVVEYLREKGAP